MLKNVIGVVVGFLVWSVLWIGSEFVVTAVAPSLSPGEDLSNITTNYLLFKLILSVVFSVVSGYLTATVSGESARSPKVLGILLLVVGIGVQASIWTLLPVWYHISFLVLLFPATAFGGRARSSNS